MTRQVQIPDKAVEALGAALGNTRPTWEYREAICAMFNAWPGRALAGYAGETCYILPLPQEEK